MKRLMLPLMLAMIVMTAARAADHHTAPTTSAATHGIDHSPHPKASTDPHWVKDLMWTIAILFAAAALVGGIVRANMPEEVPVSHAHDEPPGSSGHHGSSGTVDPHHPGQGHAPHGHH